MSLADYILGALKTDFFDIKCNHNITLHLWVFLLCSLPYPSAFCVLVYEHSWNYGFKFISEEESNSGESWFFKNIV